MSGNYLNDSCPTFRRLARGGLRRGWRFRPDDLERVMTTPTKPAWTTGELRIFDSAPMSDTHYEVWNARELVATFANRADAQLFLAAAGMVEALDDARCRFLDMAFTVRRGGEITSDYCDQQATIIATALSRARGEYGERS